MVRAGWEVAIVEFVSRVEISGVTGTERVVDIVVSAWVDSEAVSTGNLVAMVVSRPVNSVKVRCGGVVIGGAALVMNSGTVVCDMLVMMALSVEDVDTTAV